MNLSLILSQMKACFALPWLDSLGFTLTFSLILSFAYQANGKEKREMKRMEEGGNESIPLQDYQDSNS